jgi:hypothetical protein
MFNSETALPLLSFVESSLNALRFAARKPAAQGNMAFRSVPSIYEPA